MINAVEIKQIHIEAASALPYASARGTTSAWITHLANKAQEIALAEKQAQPEPVEQWGENDNSCGFDKLAEKQSPEFLIPVDPHAALRAEYSKQVKEGTTGFYLWEFNGFGWIGCNDVPSFSPIMQYRYTDISCMVSKDGEPAVRMLRTEAQELQRQTRDVCDWFDPSEIAGVVIMAFDGKGTYTYSPKATIKLDGKMVTPEQAAAEWEDKKETCDLYYSSLNTDGFERLESFSLMSSNFNQTTTWYAEYELRPKALKQVSWSDMPVWVAVQTVNKKLVCTFVGMAANNLISIYNITAGADDYRAALFELAYASEQLWIAVQDDQPPLYEIMQQLFAKGIDSCASGNRFKITGIAKGYKMEGAV